MTETEKIIKTGIENLKYAWLDEYLLSKPGVERNLQREWNWIRYCINDKMFAAVCLDENLNPVYITLKLDPAEGDFLRSEHEDIIPGYYMNKIHWNSIKANGCISHELMKTMLDKSYEQVFKSLSKKKQNEINAVK